MRFVTGGDASSLLPRTAAGGALVELQSAAGVQRRIGGAFASLGSAALIGGGLEAPLPAAPPATAGVKERRTGTVFAGQLEHCAGEHGCPIIAGAGARTKRIAGVKNLDVYALALYVDQAAARHALQPKFGGAQPASLAQDQSLFDELVKADGVEKTLRIVITSGMVKQRPFLDALEERLAPPLKQAGDLAALEAFKQQFDAAPFRKGLEVTFSTTGPQVVTRLDGKQVGSITSRHLAHSLLDIYLGTNPASKGAKDSFGAGLADMVLGR